MGSTRRYTAKYVGECSIPLIVVRVGITSLALWCSPRIVLIIRHSAGWDYIMQYKLLDSRSVLLLFRCLPLLGFIVRAKSRQTGLQEDDSDVLRSSVSYNRPSIEGDQRFLGSEAGSYSIVRRAVGFQIEFVQEDGFPTSISFEERLKRRNSLKRVTSNIQHRLVLYKVI